MNIIRNNLKNYMRKTICIIIITLSNFTFAQNNELFTKGNALYNDGKYQEAIGSYERILDSGEHSSELYFNLANAYYKLNRIAPSIYYYEKAKQLSPRDEDIDNNLSFAKNMTIDDIESIPNIGLSKIFKNVINAFGFDIWAIFSIILVFLFVILSLGYYFSYSTTIKRLAFLGSTTALFVAAITLFFAFQKYKYEQSNNPAIVFAQETSIKSEPNLRSETVFELHEGTKVQIVEVYNDNWTKIKLSNGKMGWITNADYRAL